jgi:hypothetical protein
MAKSYILVAVGKNASWCRKQNTNVKYIGEQKNEREKREGSEAYKDYIVLSSTIL